MNKHECHKISYTLNTFHIDVIFTFFPLTLVSFLSNPSLDDSGAVSPDQDDKSDGEKTEKHKKKKTKVNKATKAKHEEGKGHFIFS